VYKPGRQIDSDESTNATQAPDAPDSVNPVKHAKPPYKAGREIEGDASAEQASPAVPSDEAGSAVKSLVLLQARTPGGRKISARIAERRVRAIRRVRMINRSAIGTKASHAGSPTRGVAPGKRDAHIYISKMLMTAWAGVAEEGRGDERFAQSKFCAPSRTATALRACLLHVTSLPSPYGVGDIGPAAYAWVDRLAAAGQAWWQVLPLGPTGCGHSPYQALSSFAANLLVLSPDRLREDGLIEPQDCAHGTFASERVDFERVIAFKEHVLDCAWKNFRRGARADLRSAFERFCEEKAALLKEPALFMALRAKYLGAPFREWPEPLAQRAPKVLEKVRRELAEPIDRFHFGQFILLRHWQAAEGLRESARHTRVGRSSDLRLL
jgi:hypothetical protein